MTIHASNRTVTVISVPEGAITESVEMLPEPNVPAASGETAVTIETIEVPEGIITVQTETVLSADGSKAAAPPAESPEEVAERLEQLNELFAQIKAQEAEIESQK